MDTVRKGELEALGEELLDVRPPDVGGLLDLDDLEDLFILLVACSLVSTAVEEHTWIDLKRARWRAAMSW